MKTKRPIYLIAKEIRADWKNVYFGAEPYLEAMASMESVDTCYGLDTGRSVVNYFLANAVGWRGETARRIKAELNIFKQGSNPSNCKLNFLTKMFQSKKTKYFSNTV